MAFAKSVTTEYLLHAIVDILKQIRKALDRKATKAKYVGLSWNEVVLLLTGNDPLQCPKCKAGRMIQFEVITALQARLGPHRVYQL